MELDSFRIRRLQSLFLHDVSTLLVTLGWTAQHASDVLQSCRLLVSRDLGGACHMGLMVSLPPDFLHL